MFYHDDKNFENALEMEIRREEKILQNAESILAESPKGYLIVKRRKSGNSYYQVVTDRKGKQVFKKEINVSDNWQMVWDLFEKKIQNIMVKHTRKNIAVLNRLKNEFMTVSLETIVREQAHSYGEAFYQNRKNGLNRRIHEDFEKAPFDLQKHTHETDCGIFVRSKSEQLLANALYAYGIPFHYEERYHYKIGNIGKIYPDFTILLPDGSVIIWEHFGMLDNPSYCSRTAEKLNIYQMNGLILCKNLIITMDDYHHNFGSDVINDTIKKFILPYFKGYLQ